MHTLTLALLTCALTPDTLLQPLTSLTLYANARVLHHPPGPPELGPGYTHILPIVHATSVQ